MIFELDGHCLFGFFKPNTNIHLLITFIYILAVLVKITISKKLAIRAAERVKQKKKTSLQNQQLIFKNMLKYETNQLIQIQQPLLQNQPTRMQNQQSCTE